jgi:hypothetical protein
MKRQDILEIIVSNPEAVFKNANAEAGKYSEYPTYFQVIGMAYDKSYVRVKEVNPTSAYYLLNESGDVVRDENGDVIHDSRPISERSFLKYGTSIKSMPTRLVIKSDKTAEVLLADFIAYHEERERERAEYEAKQERDQEVRNTFANALVCAGILPNDDDISRNPWGGKVNVYFTEEAMTRLTSLLKSALVEVGV